MTDNGDSERLVDRDAQAGDGRDRALRPLSFSDFVGQKAAIANLRVFVEAARRREEALDHVLLSGPPGLGKTTLAQIVAREMGVGFRATSGPVIAKAGDLAAILTNLEPRDVLFIDEIHRLAPAVEEILYPAMEDFCLDLVIGEGPAARTVRIDLPPFTLVGATTRAGLVGDAAARPVRRAGASRILRRGRAGLHRHAGCRQVRHRRHARRRPGNCPPGPRYAACRRPAAAAGAGFRRGRECSGDFRRSGRPGAGPSRSRRAGAGQSRPALPEGPHRGLRRRAGGGGNPRRRARPRPATPWKTWSSPFSSSRVSSSVHRAAASPRRVLGSILGWRRPRPAPRRSPACSANSQAPRWPDARTGAARLLPGSCASAASRASRETGFAITPVIPAAT